MCFQPAGVVANLNAFRETKVPRVSRAARETQARVRVLELAVSRSFSSLRTVLALLYPICLLSALRHGSTTAFFALCTRLSHVATLCLRSSKRSERDYYVRRLPAETTTAAADLDVGIKDVAEMRTERWDASISLVTPRCVRELRRAPEALSCLRV